MKRPIVLSIVSAGLWLGCAGFTHVDPEFTTKQHNDLRTRAAFDLKCDAAALTITDLKTSDYGIVTTAGVTGCNSRATYLYESHNAVWVMNAVDGQPMTSSQKETP